MLVAYHNDPAIKADILRVLAEHRVADELVQGYGYWQDGKGCAVGCTIKSGNHIEYETRFGIPVALARLEDCIFEGLPVDLARQWPERFMTAIRPGADLSRVHWHLLHWILTTPDVNPGIEHPLVQEVVKTCANLVADLASGKQLDESAAKSAAKSAGSARSAARSTACSAAMSAEKAAWSAARSAAWSAAISAEKAAWSAAMSAENAAGSAENAAWSAAWSAENAAWSAPMSAENAAYVLMSDRLIEMIDAAQTS